MPVHKGIRFRDRPPDSTGKVPAYATYWDTVTDLIEEAIETLVKQGLFEGIITSPGFSVDGMKVSFNAFHCVTQDGIYCELAAGDVTHEAADASPRIDIICVDPAVQRPNGGEITGSGEIKITKGTAAVNPTVPDTPSGYLKVQEVGVPTDASPVTLRGWKPMYIPLVMFRPSAQETPDMTVKVNFGRGYISGNTLIDKDVQNSPTFTAPAANKCAIDILHIDSNGTLAITQGTEVDLPNEPSAPTYPADKMVICEVYLEAGDTAIYQSQIKDVRPVLNLGGGGLQNIVEDTTPQLGGDLDAQTKRIFDIKWLDLKAPTELTIDAGAITITQSFHTVDTEEEGATDDLVTINGGAVGRVLILRAENDARTVVIKHGTGNIWLKGKADLSLDDLEDCLVLVYTPGSKWVDIGAGGGGNGATTFLALTDCPASYSGESGKYCRVKATEDGLEFATPAGGGDMLKSTYDTDEDGKVDDAEKLEGSTKAQVQDHIPKAHTLDSHSEKKLDQLDEKTPDAGVTIDTCLVKDGKAADSNKLEGSTKTQVQDHTPKSHTHVETDITDLDHDAQKIKGKLVDAPVEGDNGKVLTYDHANSKYKHTTPAGAGDMLKSTYDTDEDGVVDKAEDLVITDQAAGDILYFDGTNWIRLPKDANKYLKSGAAAPAWDEATIGFSFAIPIDTPEEEGVDKGVFHFAPGIAGTIEEVYIMAKTAPGTDKTLTVDVNKGGVTIFTTQENRPTLSGTDTEVTSGTPDVTTFAKNDKFTIDVDVSTAESAVADVVVLIRGKQKVA